MSNKLGTTPFPQESGRNHLLNKDRVSEDVQTKISELDPWPFVRLTTLPDVGSRWTIDDASDKSQQKRWPELSSGDTKYPIEDP